ncbi:hypothetical protein ACFV1A_27350 [Streptomyces seoulensis]|uniref:hypothetical protein n=1 Tax=Streptomyces seoulensis TaxID=73044 RepID=UPI0036C696AE
MGLGLEAKGEEFVNPDGSIRVRWWLPDGLSKEVLKSLKPTLKKFEGVDLTCAGCENDIEIHHDVLLAVQLVKQDDALGIFLTHPTCAAPCVRFDPADIPFTQGSNTGQVHHLTGLRPSGEPIMLIDIAAFVHSLPPRHRNAKAATQIYAEAHGFELSENSTPSHLLISNRQEARVTVIGDRAFISRSGFGIVDEMDLSSANSHWKKAVAATGIVEFIAGVGLLRLDPPDLAGKYPALAHGRVRATALNEASAIAPLENPDEAVYKVLPIAPGMHPTVFMLDSDVIVGIERWFYGVGRPHTPTMRRQLEGLLTLRTLIGPMHVDFTLGVAENCWGRFSAPVNHHRARKIIRAVNTALSLDSEALMDLMNHDGVPAQAVRATDAFSVGMPGKESQLQTLSYTLVLNFQLLYRQSRGANTQRKLRLLSDYVHGLDRDLGFVGLYEFQIACDFLFSGGNATGYAELLLKPGKEKRVLENSWGAAWDLTHMRRADLALQGIHWDIPEVAALVSGDRALRMLRDRMTVQQPVVVDGVSTLQMKLTPPKFKSDADGARFGEILDHVYDIVDRNLQVTREQNIEKAKSVIPRLESRLLSTSS